MTPEQLVEYFAIGLALFFAYFPVVKDWFDRQAMWAKLFLQAGLMLLVVAVIYGLSCANLYTVFTCDGAGAWAAFVLFVKAFLLWNQATYQVGVRLLAKVFPFVARYQAWELGK